MKNLLIIILLLVAGLVNAQYFETGQDPASLSWRQINTENFQLIYPDYYEIQAQKLAQKLECVYEFGSYSLGHKPSKISVILHTQTVKSNGMVAYAPKRSEFYTTPHQGIYPQDWLEQLALHEFRHVVQIDKINSELPGIIKFLLGEQGVALIFGAYLPWWFTEGDAVTTETALGNFGRGRFPSFLMEHQAQVVEKGAYSYDKAYLGSYKDFVPNHYRLGYYLVAGTRKKYGSKVWEKTVKRVGEKPFSLTPFNRALKQETGLGKVQLYDTIFGNLADEWSSKDCSFHPAQHQIISTRQRTYTSYQYTHWLNDTVLISYKTSLNSVPAFVKIDKTGEEQKLFNPGIIFEESVNYCDDWIIWAEQIPNVRWTHSGSSMIKLYNISTQEKVNLTPEFKAFSPALSSNKEFVALVETDFSSNNYLSVYRTGNGELVHRIQTGDNNYFFSPEWMNQHEILAVILTDKGKRLARFDLETGEHEILIKEDMGDLKHLQSNEQKVFFVSSYSGKNALYSFDFSSKEINQLYEPRFGVAHPAIAPDGEIILSDYTASGFQLIYLHKQTGKPLKQVPKGEYALAESVAEQELGTVTFDTPDTVSYTSKKYFKTANLFNIHSWAPISVDPIDYEFRPGFSIMSQNKLGTTETILGYKWDTSEETGELYARYRYKGWFPIFDFEISTGKGASQYWLITEHTQLGKVINRDTTQLRYTWKESKFNANISLPLNLSRQTFFRLLQPEVKYELTSYRADKSTPNGFPIGRFHSLSYRLYYHQLLRKSYQDVFPDFGFILDASYRHSPNGEKGLGHLTAGQGILYLPGLLRNHGMKIYAGAQHKQKGDNFRFSDIVSYPRGWGKTDTKNLSSLAINYKMPLINPDFSMGGLVYIRRINANVFTDFAHLQGSYNLGENLKNFDYNISSYGMELTGEVNFLRFYAPVNIGVRTSYLKNIEEFSFDLLFSIDFNSL